MLARATAADADVAVLVRPSVVLLPELVAAVAKLHGERKQWLLAAASWRFAAPASWSTADLDVGDHGGDVEDDELHLQAREDGWQDRCGGAAVWAWDVGGAALHAGGPVPPFLSNVAMELPARWLLAAALQSGAPRLVVDASDAVTAVEYQLASAGGADLEPGSERWEVDINTHLAAQWQHDSPRRPLLDDVPLRLVLGEDGRWLSFQQRRTQRACRCGATSRPSHGLGTVGQHGLALKRQSRWRLALPAMDDARVRSGGPAHRRLLRPRCPCRSPWGQSKGFSSCSLARPPSEAAKQLQVRLPLGRDELLAKQAGEGGGVVVLTVVARNYLDFLMSWACRLRQLRVTNFVVAALDNETYHFAVLQGLPVYQVDFDDNQFDPKSCHFYTTCFTRITKVKSRTVLPVLRLGYSVLFSDVDVYWFHNPLPDLLSYGPGVLAIQADHANDSEPLNTHKMNSGFYLARAEPQTIAVFDEIVRHAAATNLSEQPSFYEVLCGPYPERPFRLGYDKCVHAGTNLTIQFLPRHKYPNGAAWGLWDEDDVRGTCAVHGCLVLHNNWKLGKDAKLARQVDKGLWELDNADIICRRRWQIASSSTGIPADEDHWRV
eukprot:SM000140S00580  [mRNA]  locus=s140:8125:11007:- [translate_table: standard]